jgi:hypothetical protein
VGTDRAYVRLTGTHIDTFSAQVAASLASLSTSKYNQVDDGLSFLVNYKDSVGAKAFNDLIKGNVAGVQNLMKQNKTTAVQKWEKLTHRQAGRMNNFFFGIPILAYTSWSAGKIYDLSNSQAFYNNTRSDVQYGIYLSQKRTRLFGLHFSTTEAFYGSVFKVTDLSMKALTKGIFGQYTWNSDDDSSDHKDLRVMIKELVKKTGMANELAVNIPTLGDLQYSKVTFQVTLNEEQTLALMKKLSQASTDEVANYIVGKSKAYFAVADSFGLCTPNELERGGCDARVALETRNASRALVNAAKVMLQQYSAGSDKGFAMAYADLGKAMLQNPFLFQTVLEVAGSDVEINYAINNTYFSSYNVKFMTTKVPGKFTKALVAPTVNGLPGISRDATSDGATTFPPFLAPTR